MTFRGTCECLLRRLIPHPSSRPTGGACPEPVEGSGGIPARSEKQTPESGDEIPPLRPGFNPERFANDPLSGYNT